MPRPLDIPDSHKRVAQSERHIRRLERRGAGPWHYVGSGAPEPDFQSPWQNLGGGKMNLRFRFALGGGVELQGSVTGGALGTTVFTLPEPFRPIGGEVRLSGNDDLGELVVWQILVDGSVICGLALV